MKIIFSHDVDHFTWSEHLLRDWFIPKFILKNGFYILSGQLPVSVGLNRIGSIPANQYGNLKRLAEFDLENGIPSTFFIAMNNGLSLSYSRSQAEKSIKYLMSKGITVGLHGIEFDDIEGIREEYDDFLKVVGSNYSFGIRNHYLRQNETKLAKINSLGYLFDSTEYEIKDMWHVDDGKMVEFPVCLMDSYLLTDTQNDLKYVQEKTLAMLEQAENRSLRYFTINTHDCYFSKLFPEHESWYKWLVEYTMKHYKITDFLSAIKECSLA